MPSDRQISPFHSIFQNQKSKITFSYLTDSVRLRFDSPV
uniref:Uncharacterized protein n=1 Tax=Rhizophora mucronata TaxID=61149 RepID=A0A2P2NT58_RHIMU